MAEHNLTRTCGENRSLSFTASTSLFRTWLGIKKKAMPQGRITPHQLSPAVSGSIPRLTCLTATQLMHGTLGTWRTPRIVMNTLPAGNSTNTDTKVVGHIIIYTAKWGHHCHHTSLEIKTNKKKWRIFGNHTKLFRWAMWKRNSKQADEKRRPNSECLTTLSI